ncbi:hypothetical protein [Longimicrobium sp.]|uniref:hypothetical protein n=1 Tax=Longimicrobium sp. TaxID=2029185 RepID=UPI002C7F4280|nr:hypothetical protein [Longimicrobium sp.]HSU12781.1 hypothetical protein [Longimicrobium sp.]
MTKLRIRRAQAAAFAILALAACSENGGGITPADPPAITPPNTVAAISCNADVRSKRLSCADAAPGGLRGDRIIGGQRQYVFVQSSNVAYGADSIFSADVTVQNLLTQRMGSDGTTVSGISVFFATGPNVTAGTGFVEMAGGDVGTFSASGQPFFFYPGTLAPDSVTPPQRWKWKMPPSVVSFAFTVYVSTPIVPTIVFEMAPGGNRDIYRMGVDGNDLKKLSTSALTDANPTVAQGTVVFTSYRDGNAELYSVPLKGGTETRLTATTGLNETSPALSPDGRRLAWAQGAPGGVTKIWYGRPTADSAAAANPGSGDAIEASPNWADSSRLAFTSAAGGSADIYSVSGIFPLKTGGTASLLTGGTSADVEAAWSPDRTRVVFASNRSGDTELYMLTVGTGTVTRLTTRTGSDGAPTWVYDGSSRSRALIVYTCVQGGVFHLCMLDPDSPATVKSITTPFAADHASGVRF